MHFNENIDNQVVMYDDTTKIEFSKTDITNGKDFRDVICR